MFYGSNVPPRRYWRLSLSIRSLALAVIRTTHNLHTIRVEVDHIMVLMEKYSNTPMDLADASLLSLAETHAFTRIFTIDSDFNIYRLKDGNALKIIQ